MSFYLKPPRGIIAYHILQKCVEERLRFFNNITRSELSVYSIEYLFEDSAFDRAGHFTLRLAAVKNPGFVSYFINSELQLLKLRLDSYNGKLTRTFLKNVLRHVKECVVEDGVSENVVTFLNTVDLIFTKMSSKSYCSHVFKETHIADNKCKYFTLNVPFRYCTSLISQRLVDLKNGYAKIPCEKWKDLLLTFFHIYLHIVINEMKHSKNVLKALEDHRIKSILLSINIEENNTRDSNVSLDRINHESKYFPLCMQNLQNILQKQHRLAHEERFNFSLFLKDIGVSLEDSISYWKSEYSKDHSNCTPCSHSWQKNERKYIYSIRHLYGLEGSRNTYKARSCNYFQNIALSPMQEGGCPFKHFDNDKLKDLLSVHIDKSSDHFKNILSQRSASPLNACKLFLNIASTRIIESKTQSVTDFSTSINCDISFSNPVQYFLTMKNF